MVQKGVGSSATAMLGFDLAAAVITARAITVGTMAVSRAITAAVGGGGGGGIVVALGLVESVLRRCRVPVVKVYCLEWIVYS
jgi:hypothetical protein